MLGGLGWLAVGTTVGMCARASCSAARRVRCGRRWRRRYRRAARPPSVDRRDPDRTGGWSPRFWSAIPPHSSRAYFSDLKAWYAWCTEMGVHPRAARRHHVDVWVRHLSQEPQPATGPPASPALIVRRLSCLSKFMTTASTARAERT